MDRVTIALIAIGVTGTYLCLSSAPPFAGRRLARRVEPFLHGLEGKPSTLLVRPSAVRSRLLTRLAARAMSNGDVARRLDAAGRVPDEIAFRVEQLAWGAAAFTTTAVSLSAAVALGMTRVGVHMLAVPLVAAVTGALARDWYLTKEIERRREDLVQGLPTAIDHMTLALLAGESIPGTFRRIAATAHGAVASEFARVDADLRGGATVVDALEAFRDRMDDAAIRRFVDSLCAAVERGTSVAEVLRAQADDVREARRRNLLESGGRREIVMLVPVVFLILPVVVLFALYPGLVSLDLLVR